MITNGSDGLPCSDSSPMITKFTNMEEEGLLRFLQGSPTMRGAYYLNNWGMVREEVRLPLASLLCYLGEFFASFCKWLIHCILCIISMQKILVHSVAGYSLFLIVVHFFCGKNAPTFHIIHILFSFTNYIIHHFDRMNYLTSNPDAPSNLFISSSE